MKLHLEELLLAQCNYWRKRCTIRWIKVGEDNTKFFHAMATQKFRRNAIASLRLYYDEVINDHDRCNIPKLWNVLKIQNIKTFIIR